MPRQIGKISILNQSYSTPLKDNNITEKMEDNILEKEKRCYSAVDKVSEGKPWSEKLVVYQGEVLGYPIQEFLNGMLNFMSFLHISGNVIDVSSLINH